MEAFNTIISKAAPLPLENIDTDQVIPARFLKSTTRDGFGENLFRPGGRGLLLMNSYMDMVKYNEQGNSVYLVRYKEKPTLTESQGQTEA